MLIAISGFKGSGKDTLADFLVKTHDFKRISFADPLKDLVASNFGVSRKDLDDSNKKEKPLLNYPVPATDEFTKMLSNFMVREFRTSKNDKADVKYIRSENGILETFILDWEPLYHTPRSLAILVGSSMRAATSNFWVKKAIDSMTEHLSFEFQTNFVISDLRYKSEAKQLKEAFGDQLVTVRINRFDSSPSADPSELDLVDYKHDFEIDNKGKKEDLFLNIESIFKTITQK